MDSGGLVPALLFGHQLSYPGNTGAWNPLVSGLTTEPGATGGAPDVPVFKKGTLSTMDRKASRKVT